MFGSGQAARLLAEEVARLGSKRVMVVAASYEKGIASKVTSDIAVAATFDDVVQHVPIEKAELARAMAVAEGVDLIVCIGGGSTTGFAKAVAMTTGIPIVAVPTTYAGSEATPVWGLTEASRKTTGIDVRVLPVTVIYDASLTYSLPIEMSVASGLNALAHCVDSMWAPKADPINQAFAVEGIRTLAQGLPLIVGDPQSEDGREKTLYGAYLSAVSFGSAGSGMHHKICHVLGGTFSTPHAQTHAIVLPYVLAFNSSAAPEAQRRIAQAFDAPTALAGLQDLRAKLDAPKALKDYGFNESDIAEAVSIALPIIPADNPRAVTTDNLTALLHAAWSGSAPTV